MKRVELLPDGTLGLLFQITDGSVARPGSRDGNLYVVGTRTTALYKTTQAVPLAVMLRFRPGTASAILGVPAQQLTDRIVGLEDLWGADGRHLRRTMLSVAEIPDMIALLQATIEARAIRAGQSPSLHLAQQAVSLITRRPTPISVADLAARLEVTTRHLRRVFTTEVGIGPKEFLRVIRFQRAAGAAAPQNWASVAAEAGYYDQAHMIRDFRALTGRTPSRLQAAAHVRRHKSQGTTMVVP
ncbi:MAG: helix-turn-helix transcriptional regulator [Acidobacteria bacterium]|nr:helix-turn-helix transcriptional regulator [Acidobacteriota bacterium]